LYAGIRSIRDWGRILSNKILHIAVHDLLRTSEGFQIKLGKDGVPITSTTQRVIDELHNLYGRRASKSYGKFSTNEEYLPTQKHLREYVKGKFRDFAMLTTNLMGTLQRQASYKNAAAGGHVFFAHFERDTCWRI
jgi:nucleoid-associated protein